MDPVSLPMEPSDRLYDPPLIDHLNREETCLVIEFVPADWVSADEKCSVVIALASPDGRMICGLLDRIDELSHAKGLRRIVHGGGGDYRLVAIDGRSRALADLGPNAAIETADRIHQIAEAAQIAYRLQIRGLAKSA